MASADDTAVTAGDGTPLPLAAGDPSAPDVPPHTDDGAAAPPVTVPTPVAPTPTTPPDAEPVSGSTTGAGPTTTVAPSPPATPRLAGDDAPRGAGAADRQADHEGCTRFGEPAGRRPRSDRTRPGHVPRCRVVHLADLRPARFRGRVGAGRWCQSGRRRRHHRGGRTASDVTSDPAPAYDPPGPGTIASRGDDDADRCHRPAGATTGAETAQGSLPVTGLDDATLRLAGIGLLLLDVGYLMWSVTRPARSRRSSALLASEPMGSPTSARTPRYPHTVDCGSTAYFRSDQSSGLSSTNHSTTSPSTPSTSTRPRLSGGSSAE